MGIIWPPWKGFMWALRAGPTMTEGSFYPEGVKGAERLSFYASRFDTVEVNASFYRFPDRADDRSLEPPSSSGFLTRPSKDTGRSRTATNSSTATMSWKPSSIASPN